LEQKKQTKTTKSTKSEKIDFILRILKKKFPKTKIQLCYRKSKTHLGMMHWWAQSSILSGRIMREILSRNFDLKIRQRMFIKTFSLDMKTQKKMHYVKLEILQKSRKKVNGTISKKAPKIQQPA